MSWSSTHVLFWIIGPPSVCVCGGGGGVTPMSIFRLCPLQGSNPCRGNPNNKYQRPSTNGHLDPQLVYINMFSNLLPPSVTPAWFPLKKGMDARPSSLYMISKHLSTVQRLGIGDLWYINLAESTLGLPKSSIFTSFAHGSWLTAWIIVYWFKAGTHNTNKTVGSCIVWD